MSEPTQVTDRETRYRAKLLKRPLKATWWTENPRYVLFVLRELSACFIALFAVGTIFQVGAIRAGEASWNGFLATMKHPGMIVLSVLVLGFALLHSITWFNLAGKVLVIQQGEKRVPGEVVAGAHFAGWIVVSIVLTVLVIVAAGVSGEAAS